ncbi:MAG: Rieske (2Fe-2S) protein [Candidatus Rokubacteria bacterium]|nr:Rieske (2Fe-2S) protein [Candidatus Rokubacteria bacterium]MBI3827075.1 Rieske (2Fe-2S) protein [Candidatus Rokubacteria bacterium]
MTWVAVASAADIPVGQGAFVEADGLAFAVFNAGGGRFYATSHQCPHEDGPLAEGWLEGASVICPWHGFDFDLTTGGCKVDEGLTIAVYPARVVSGRVEVDLP